MFASNRSSRRGLTLLEVMVAITVAGVLLTVILQGFGANLGSLSVSSRYAVAIDLAKERMLELEARDKPAPGFEEGQADESRPGMKWRAEVGEEGPKGFHRATVSVRFLGSGTEREVTLTTLLCTAVAQDASSSRRPPPPKGY